MVIGEGWFIEKMNAKLPHINRRWWIRNDIHTFSVEVINPYVLYSFKYGNSITISWEILG